MSEGVALWRNMTSTKKTLEMLVTGDFLPAKEALEYGLINRVVKDEEEMDRVAKEMAQKIISAPFKVIQLGKKGFYQQIQLPIEQAFSVGEDFMVDNLLLDETQEGLSAFLEKRV